MRGVYRHYRLQPQDPLADLSTPSHSHSCGKYGHYDRLEVDGITEWPPSFLKLAPTLKVCSKCYKRFCQQYRHDCKGAPKCQWGSRMLKRLVKTSGSKKKRVSPGQIQLPFAFDLRLNQIPDDWHQIAVRFRRANGIRDCDRERCVW